MAQLADSPRTMLNRFGACAFRMWEDEIGFGQLFKGKGGVVSRSPRLGHPPLPHTLGDDVAEGGIMTADDGLPCSTVLYSRCRETVSVEQTALPCSLLATRVFSALNP